MAGRRYTAVAAEQSNDSCMRCIEELRYRFKDRGVMNTVRRDARQQSGTAIRTRAIAPGAYSNYGLQSRVSDKYRTGVYEGGRYMTAADFVRYYEAHRRSARPDADLRFMAVVREDVPVAPAPKKVKKSILPAATAEDRRRVRPVISKLPSAILEKHPSLEERAAEVHGWLTADKIQDAPREKRRPFPVSVASAILVMTISLILVVGGTVMESDANAVYRESTRQLAALKEEELDLEQRLSVKNDLAEISDYARNTLGMVDRKYVEGTYLNVEREERIEAYAEETPTFGLSTLLSALGFSD